MSEGENTSDQSEFSDSGEESSGSDYENIGDVLICSVSARPSSPICCCCVNSGCCK